MQTDKTDIKMETIPQPITYRSVTAATITADNSADTSRRFAISAELHMRNGTLDRITGGNATGLDGNRVRLADFGLNSDGSLWLTLSDPSQDGQGVLDAVTGFIADARQKVETDAPVRI